MPKFVAASNVASCALGDGNALLDLTSGTYYSMNVVAAHVWDLLKTPMAIDDVVASVANTFEANGSDLKSDMTALLSELQSLRLVEVASEQ